MKKVFLACLILLLCVSAINAHAQISFSWKEFFKQKKTEKRYMLTQIAQLQLYLQVLKQGYNVVHSGLQTVNQVKNGEFSLHELFYSNLFRVNPAITRLPAAVNTIGHSQSIYRNARHFIGQVSREPSLTADQRSFLMKTCGNLLADVDRNVEQLTLLLTPGRLQMSDHDRIARLETILEESKKQLSFSKGFFNDARVIAFGKRSEKIEHEVLKNLYYLK